MLLEEILQRHRASRVAPVYDLERLWNSWQYIHRTHSPSFETFKNETVLFLSRHKRTHTPTRKTPRLCTIWRPTRHLRACSFEIEAMAQ